MLRDPDMCSALVSYLDGNTAATTMEETPASISIDQPESAATEVEEACKQLLLDAAKHVKMARKQRSLF